LLPKRERISSRARIKAILKTKQIHITSPLLNIVAEVNHEPFPRWVVICTKRLGGAVRRNRVRRVFLAALSKIRHKIDKKMDIIIFPKATNAVVTLGQVETALERSVARI
jgi:ribonuclease P protein component